MAEAKRRFSELISRVGTGERFLILRRGRPAVAIVPPDPRQTMESRPNPKGLAAVAGALADWEDLEDVVEEIYLARRKARDRAAPELD